MIGVTRWPRVEGKTTTEPRWRGLQMDEALAVRSAPSAIARAFQVTADWASQPIDAYVRGKAVMRTETRIPFRGWRMISFATYVRYQRGAMLEVLNQDYIRTARAKGLSERVVIVRHALRNATQVLSCSCSSSRKRLTSSKA